MAKKHYNPLPDREELLKLLAYDELTGILTWKVNKGPNARAGNKAGSLSDKGYRVIKINGVSYFSHRIIWKMMTREEPIEIDHIDGVKYNNKFSNLRSVTAAENNLNMRKFCTNTSGVTGVWWNHEKEKWASQISRNNKSERIGYFNNFEDAVAARKAAELKYGFHENHGRD